MISIVIPVFNEAESLGPLMSELNAMASEESLELEIIFVDDGSSDDTWKTIAKLAAADHGIRGIRFRRNSRRRAASGFRRWLQRPAGVRSQEGGLKNESVA